MGRSALEVALPPIAAIDVGTNSIHMIIARVGEGNTLEVLSRDREAVRLGQAGGDIKYLASEAIARGVEVMERFVTMAEQHRAYVRAVGTSAVREALNREEFLRAVEERTGVRIEVIAGEEEARLIYVGVIHGLPLVAKKLCICDIGGGSTEVAIGRHGTLDFVRSDKVGAIRLTEQFFREMPRPRAIERCREFLRGFWSPTLEGAKEVGWEEVAVTSGTWETIARVALGMSNSNAPQLHGRRIERAALRNAIERIVGARTIRQIEKIPGMDAGRADIITAGALIAEHFLEQLGIESVVISTFALREGVVFDTAQHLRDSSQYHHLVHLRKATIDHLCRRYGVERNHARHVAKLALELFDQLSFLHGLGDHEREMLEAAALLHDAGYHIAPDQHHKHSFYLISNAVMPGFSSTEAEIIANVARYHRKSHPKRHHEHFAALPERWQDAVRWMAACLRIAEGLDRRRQQRIHRVSVRIEQETIVIDIDAEQDVSIELWGARRRVTLLEELSERTVIVVTRCNP
jgi:exopolyphosphatase/guanosine-5'-triphosphate,3'-diphosphate pyrophosphatase